MYRHFADSDTAYIYFTKEGERELCSVPFHVNDITRRLIPVEIDLDSKNDKAELTIGERHIIVNDIDLPAANFAPQLSFGLTRHIVETASISLSDLSITSDGVTTVIPLNESSGNVVHDAEGNIAGRAHNPIWLINEAYHWEKLVEFKSSTPTGCAYNPLTQQFYSYNNDSLRTFNPDSRLLTSIPLKGEGKEQEKFPSVHGMNLFSTSTGKILPYEIYYDNFTGIIDPATGSWTRLNQTPDNKAIHHHTHTLLPNDSSVLLFGGYGNRAYFNKLVKFNLYTHRFDTIPLSGDPIAPRFFASVMATPSADTLYLYGGKGNMEGNQDLGVKYFYDCYLIDLKNHTAKRLWNADAPKYDRVPARTLIPSDDGATFYAMTYPEYRPHSSLQLYRISLADGSETAVGDSISLISEEIATNVALYNAPEIGKIFCVVQEFEKEGATTTSIYSIANPPVSKAELSAYIKAASSRKISPLAIILLCVGGVAAISLIIIFIRHKKRKTAKSVLEKTTTSETTPAREITPVSETTHASGTTTVPESSCAEDAPSVAPAAESSIASEVEVEAAPAEAAQSSSPKVGARELTAFELPAANRLSLFGPFTAIDPAGHDISHLFSPKQRMLLIYVLMASLRKGGVSSSTLSSIFWPDKEPDKIKNLRNVTIAKLRKSLADLPGIELTYANSLFTVNIQEGCYCDVVRLYNLTGNLTDTAPSAENIPEIMAIICQGKFLQGMDSPELDSCKSVVESYTVDLLTSSIDKDMASGRYEDAKRYCNALLLIDPLSEPAVRNAVKVYMALDRQARARSIYDTFCNNYRKIYAQNPPFTFSDLIV